MEINCCFNNAGNKIEGLVILKGSIYNDFRGSFSEVCNLTAQPWGRTEFVPTTLNISRNLYKGTIRGMHYQEEPYSQNKLIRCIRGSIYDVAIDLRRDSSTYLSWYSITLSSEDNKALFIPNGFAHGFCTLKNNTDVLYAMDGEYSELHSRCLRWNDEKFNIHWPLSNPIMTDKDKFAHDYGN